MPGQRHAELERVLRGPAAGALLLGGVEDHVDEWLAGRVIGLGQHASGDLDQERFELAVVPGAELIGDRVDLEAGAVAEQVIALGDQLHVGVLDPVVDHLHVVARAVGADVGAARRAVDRRGDRLEDRLDGLVVGLAVAAGHDARPVERALLAARDADAEEVDAALGELGVTPLGVAEVGVAAVDHDVAALQVRGDLVDHGVGGGARLNHAHQHARPLERPDPIRDRLMCGDRSLRAVLVHESLGPARGSVVDRDRDLVMGDVARQVRAHRREPGEAEVSVRRAHRVNVARAPTRPGSAAR